jgi:glycerol kinase
MILNLDGKVVTEVRKEHQQIYPKPGWVEHNPREIWLSASEVINEALRKNNIKTNEIEAVGITNQRETTVLWDIATKVIISHVRYVDR